MSKTVYHTDTLTDLRLRAVELMDGTYRIEQAVGGGVRRDTTQSGTGSPQTSRPTWLPTRFFIEAVPNTTKEIVVLEGRDERVLTVVGETSIKTALRRLVTSGAEV